MPGVRLQVAALAWTTLGQELARSRKAAGYTQESFAPLTHYGRSTIANVETGRQRVGRGFWITCDKILKTGGALTKQYDDLQQPVVRRPVSGSPVPQVLQQARAELRGTADESATTVRDTDYLSGEWNSFSTLTGMLAQQRQAVSPEVLLGLIEAHRDCLSTLFRKAGRAPIRADIGAMLAEASIVASRLWSAQGNRSLALAHCAYARQLGDRLGNRQVSATARIFESNLYSEAATLIEADGDVMVGLRLLDEAAHARGDLSSAAHARIAAEQAQTYAALQLPKETDAALARAEKAINNLSPGDCVGLYSDWSHARLQVYVGTCHLLLGRTRTAINVLETAIAALEPDHCNVNVALAATVDLASAHAEAGDLQRSCSLLASTYERLQISGNHRGIARAQRAQQRLNRWQSEPMVLELRKRMIV